MAVLIEIQTLLSRNTGVNSQAASRDSSSATLSSASFRLRRRLTDGVRPWTDERKQASEGFDEEKTPASSISPMMSFGPVSTFPGSSTKKQEVGDESNETVPQECPDEIAAAFVVRAIFQLRRRRTASRGGGARLGLGHEVRARDFSGEGEDQSTGKCAGEAQGRPCPSPAASRDRAPLAQEQPWDLRNTGFPGRANSSPRRLASCGIRSRSRRQSRNAGRCGADRLDRNDRRLRGCSSCCRRPHVRSPGWTPRRNISHAQWRESIIWQRGQKVTAKKNPAPIMKTGRKISRNQPASEILRPRWAAGWRSSGGIEAILANLRTLATPILTSLFRAFPRRPCDR